MKITQLGDYVLEKRIGSGGMGEVFRARQVSLDRTVAVKVLPRSLASQQGFTERFQREARAAANLIHPNVIQVYSIGLDKGIPYFAMEYVEGEDLQQRMKRQRFFDFDEIVRIIRDATGALSVAHEKGIVHRDIKPSNIMFDRAGNLKVMDFGLAKITAANSNLTQSGLIMGTPNYMSPEQGKGEPTDTRSDIYSLGVVFYELMTGSLPFRADTPTALIYKHAYEKPPSPREKNPEIPPYLEYICLKMICKDPTDRYAAPKELLKDLEEFMRDRTFYMSGGMPESKDLMTDQTMVEAPGTGRTPQPPVTASGRTPVPQATTQPGHSQSAVNTAAYASQSGVAPTTAAGQVTAPHHAASTMAAQTTHAGAMTNATQAQTLLEGRTLPPYHQPPGGNGWKIFALFLIALAIGGAVFRDEVAEFIRKITEKPQEGPQTYALALSDLWASAKAVRTKVNIEWLPSDQMHYLACPDVDRDVPPGKYHFRLLRDGYETQEFIVEISDQGQVEPELNSRPIAKLFEQDMWVPSPELLDAYQKGTEFMSFRNYDKAIKQFDIVIGIDPGYADVGEKRRQCADRAEAYEARIREVHATVSQLTTALQAKSMTKARERAEAALALIQGSEIENDPRIGTIQTQLYDKLSIINGALEDVELYIDNGDKLLADGEWDEARDEYVKAERKNQDDPRPAKKIDLCEDMKNAWKTIQASAQHEAEDDETLLALEQYLETCPGHDDANDLLGEVKRRTLAGEELQERLDELASQIDAIVLSPAENKDWTSVLAFAKEMLQLDPANTAAAHFAETAQKQLDEGGVESTLSRLAAVFLEPDPKVRQGTMRELVRDRDFEPAWQTFLSENAEELQLVNSSFALHSTLFDGNSCTVEGRWHYELFYRSFGQKLIASSDIKVTLVRDEEGEQWDVERFEPVDPNTDGTVE